MPYKGQVVFEVAFRVQKYYGTETQSLDCRLEVGVVMVASSVQAAVEVDR